MAKREPIHFRIIGEDYRYLGQSEHCYTHQTLCGYERKYVTFVEENVTCKCCLNGLDKIKPQD